MISKFGKKPAVLLCQQYAMRRQEYIAEEEKIRQER